MKRNKKHTEALLLKIGAYIARICGILLTILVGVLTFASATSLGLYYVVDAITSWIPHVLSGAWVIATPMGGVFRGDLAACAVVFFLLDWALTKASARVKECIDA